MFQVDVDSRVAEAAAEAAAGGGGKGFPPLPAGNYQANIVPLKKDGDRVEVVPFGGSGANSQKKVLRVAVQIVADSPTGAKKWFAIRVPLFTRYAPNEKHPEGAPARMYFDFLRAIGVPEDDILAGRFPDPNHWMGKQIGITISEPIEPDKWNPLGSNEVSFVNKPGQAATAPRYPEGKPKAPWLLDDDSLNTAYPFASPEAQAVVAEALGQAPTVPAQGGATPPPTSWATQPGGAAPTGAPAPTWNQQAAAPAQGQPPAPTWNQPATSGLQAAADSAGVM